MSIGDAFHRIEKSLHAVPSEEKDLAKTHEKGVTAVNLANSLCNIESQAEGKLPEVPKLLNKALNCEPLKRRDKGSLAFPDQLSLTVLGLILTSTAHFMSDKDREIVDILKNSFGIINYCFANPSENKT